MLALTLHNPWPWCIAHLPSRGAKRVENRGWPPPKRLLGERFAIHAGQACNAQAIYDLRYRGVDVPSTIASSALICTTRLVAVVRGEGLRYDVVDVARGFDRELVKLLVEHRDGMWLSGEYGWVLSDVIALPEPVKCAGKQGLWPLTEMLESAVRAQGACP